MSSEKLARMAVWICVCGMLIFSAGCTREAKAKRHLGRADRFFQSGDYAKAEIEYLNVLRFDGRNRAAVRQLGLILFDEGRYPQALEFLQRTKVVEPGNLDVRAKIGFVALLARNLAQAREEALFVLGKEPANEVALVLLADSVETGQLEETRALLEKYRGAAQRVAGYHVAWGVLHGRGNDWEAAEASFKEAVRLNSGSAVAHATLGNLYWRQGRLELAEEEFKAAASAAPARSPLSMSLADFKIKQGRVEEGKELLEAIAKTTPDFIPVRIRLAEVALSRKDYDRCAAVLKGILSSGQANYDAQFLQGRLYLARGDTAEALKEFQRLATAFPKVPQIHHQLALVHLANRDVTTATASLNEALTLDPKYTDGILLKAELNIRNGEYLPAIAALKGLSGSDTNLVQTDMLLAAAYAGRKDYAAALVLYEKLAKAHPQNPQFSWLIGNMHLRQKNTPEARLAFEQALAANAGYFPAFEALVDIDLSAGDHGAAMQRVQSRLSNTTNAALNRLLAKVWLLQGNTNQAEAALLNALKLDPGDQSAQMSLAHIYVNTKSHQQALERLQAIIRKRPGDIGTHLQAAAIYEQLKDFKAAEEHYQKILSVQPNFATALNNLAYIYSEHLNDLERAFQMAQKAYAALPNNPATTDTLGWVLYKRGDYSRALVVLEQSAQMLPDNSEVLFHLGMTHYALGNEDAARTIFEKSLEHASDFPGKAECERRLSILTMNLDQADVETVRQLEKLAAQGPADPIVLGRLARVYERSGEADKAARTYESMLKQNPNNIPAMIGLARYYFERGKNKEKAMEWAQKARKAAPYDARVAHALGRLAYETRDFKWSLSLLQESARKLRDDPQVALDLAWAQLGNGQLSECQATLKRAVESAAAGTPLRSAAEELGVWVSRCIDPGKADQFADQIEKVLKADGRHLPARFLSGCVRQKRGDFKGAAAALESVLAEYPLFSPANKELAYVYAEYLPNEEKAWEHSLRARAAYPEDVKMAKTLGIITYKRGDWRGSIDLLKESTRKGADAEALFYLGMAHWKLGDQQESGKALREALALDPNARFVTEAKEVLAQLR